MEEAQKFFRNISNDLKSMNSSSSSSSSSSSETPYFSGKGGLTAALPSSDQSRILVSRPPRQMVSLWNCSKLCAVFFVAGVVVGYTLKRRVRRLAAKLLRRLKDD